ncbi:MAG: hypothetical protein JWN11_1968 [Hyphomicrobiales bacterium]|nr:hypothetical protein [Hyphomicrobiales bacterium]
MTLLKLIVGAYRGALRRYQSDWHPWTTDRKVMLINGGFAYRGDIVLRRRLEAHWEYARQPRLPF